jgi:DNA invertase Pin-like site-specific DNA recombinase
MAPFFVNCFHEKTYKLFKSNKKIMAIYGYARISTHQQDLFSQIEQLQKVDPTIIIFKEVASTARSQPELISLLVGLKKDDTLVVTELSRLGRNLRDLLNIGQDLKERGINLISLKEGIDTRTTMGSLLFNIFGALYEFEVSNLRERTKRALESKRARGRMGGKPKKDKKIVELAIKAYEEGIMTINEIVSVYKISRSTLYRKLREKKK